MKKVTLILLSLILIINQTHAEEEKFSGYKLYENRVKNICNQKIYEPAKPILKKEGYIEYQDLEVKISESAWKNIWNNLSFKKNDAGDGIDLAKETYKHNMNTTYKCALLNPQIKGIEKIQVLIKGNPSLEKKLGDKLRNKIEKLKLSKNSLGCSDNEPSKKDVLRTTTKELCIYHSYLEYLREYNSDISKLIQSEDMNKKITDESNEKVKNSSGIKKKIGEISQSISSSTQDTIVGEKESYNISYIVELEKQKKLQIDREIIRVYDIFPIAFDAYNQYETNLSLHLHLELIKEDYITFRRKLYNVTSPINQVVYKIANAMKK